LIHLIKKKDMKNILVIGSSNVDLIAKVKDFPLEGETIVAQSFFQAMGGKGANQAMAAHKLGGKVNFITCVGSDPYGKDMMDYFYRNGLNTEGSKIVEGVPSGTAMILINQKGQNCIVITPGANNKLNLDHIRQVKGVIQEADIILLQMEIPYESVKTICKLGHEQGKKIILNVAPAKPVDADTLKCIDVLVVNETEAETITGKILTKGKEKLVVKELLKKGPDSVVLTMGEEGCIYMDKKTFLEVDIFEVIAKDTTGAGDVFCGAIATGLSRGDSWEHILEFASAASALCVTMEGAQPSIPTAEEVHQFMKENVTPKVNQNT
jgi:ribokinase